MKEIGKRIMKQVKKGNHDAFQKLVQHYQQSVYNICILMMGNEEKAEELAGETFLYAYSNMDDYFETDKQFSIWLYQSLVCLAEKQLKGDVCMNKVEGNHSTDGILSLLVNVSLKERIALILSCYYHLSDQEIGEVLHAPKSKIRTYIWRAREILRKKLGQGEYTEKGCSPSGLG